MTFESPNILLLILALLPLAGLFFWYADKSTQKRLNRFIAPALAQSLASSLSLRRRRLKRVLIFIACVSLLIALAGPQYGYYTETRPTSGVDVVFALDVSKSMLAKDVKPSRLKRSKLAIIDLLSQLEGDRVGLIAFAGEAFLQCPLTLDYNAFRQTLDMLDTSSIARGGSNLAAAIYTTLRALKNNPGEKLLVLISDGEDLEQSSIQAAKVAASEELRILTLGVGSPEGELISYTDDNGQQQFVRDASGKLVTTKLDVHTLQQIAQITGGFYQPLNAAGITTIYNEGIAPLIDQELGEHTQRRRHHVYQYPLAFALILLVIESTLGLRRRSKK